MKILNEVSIIASLVIGVVFTSGLTLTGHEEGPCMIPKAQEDINIDWMSKVPKWYFSAGSEFELLKTALGSPSFPTIPEYNFFYEFCPYGKINSENGSLSNLIYGFKEEFLGSYGFTFENGIFQLQVQPPHPNAGQRVTVVTTLTDNKSFLFTYKCWNGINQKGWILSTASKTVSIALQKEIEAHAVSLGFDRNKFVFFRYDLCNDNEKIAKTAEMAG